MECSVKVCTKLVKSLGLCQGHYFRYRRTGSPGTTPLRESIRECHRDDCTSRAEMGPRCLKHGRRFAKWGDEDYVHRLRGPANTSWKEEPKYGAAHQRVRSFKGLARDHKCVNCGAQAKHWSYDHKDPNELISDLGPYSANPDHYQPMCVSCHKHMDLTKGSS